VIGDGFHLFDKSYLLLGFTWQRPCSATSLELEASLVPSAFISRGLWWFGLYATAGFQTLHDQESPRPSEEAPCFSSQGTHAPVVYREWAPRGFRAGAGLEAGWRMLAVDVGALYNDTLVGRSDAEKHRELQSRAERFDAPPPSDTELVPYGMRFRVGLSLADELFTGGRVKYGRHCCTKPAGENSVTPCECERTPVGGSLFIYYGNELYWNGNGRWSDGMFGISLKVGIGL
jgi:hypothetical protein